MGAVEHIKEVADLVKKFNDIDLNRRILNLEEEVIDLSRNKRRLEETVEELRHALKFRGEVKFKEPFYWLDGDNAPYCPTCWESSAKVVHVVHTHTNAYGQYWECHVCKSHFTTHGIPGRG